MFESIFEIRCSTYTCLEEMDWPTGPICSGHDESASMALSAAPELSLSNFLFEVMFVQAPATVGSYLVRQTSSVRILQVKWRIRSYAGLPFLP